MDELEPVANAALAGLGLTVVASDNILDELRAGTLVRVLSNYTIHGHDRKTSQIVIQYPERRHLSAKVAAVVDFLLSRLRHRDAAVIATHHR